jgi:hypothetical protein
MKVDIDRMVQDLLESLSPGGITSDNFESLMIRAINVATIQLDYANYEVGEVVKKQRSIKGMAIRSALEDELMVTIVTKKKYAKILGLGLDRLVEMYHPANG